MPQSPNTDTRPSLTANMAGPSLDGLLNPDILVWAREASALDHDEAARRANVKPEKLQAWEQGQGTPTLRQLRAIANAYKRSVSVFFFRERPVALRLPRDFRRLELSAAGKLSPELVTSIRESYAKREAALDIFAQMEDEPPTFDFRLPPNATPEDAGRLLVERLNMPIERRNEWRNHYDALNEWKRAIEAQGVMVMQASGIDTAEMRGCSISLSPLPIIILNSGDAPLGRVFTLLHELTHLAHRASGLCDFSESHTISRETSQAERYCNHAAGAALVPRDDLLAQANVSQAARNTQWTDEQLLELRGRYWASRETILRRLQMVGKTSPEYYARRRERFLAEYRALQEEGEGFAYWYRRVIARNGRFLTTLVLDAYNANAITGSEVSRVLGTKLDHLPRIEAAVRG